MISHLIVYLNRFLSMQVILLQLLLSDSNNCFIILDTWNKLAIYNSAPKQIKLKSQTLLSVMSVWWCGHTLLLLSGLTYAIPHHLHCKPSRLKHVKSAWPQMMDFTNIVPVIVLFNDIIYSNFHIHQKFWASWTWTSAKNIIETG